MSFTGVSLNLLLQVLLLFVACPGFLCQKEELFSKNNNSNESSSSSHIFPPDPEVTIAVLIRNKAFALSYSLAGIERLNYNRSRLSLIFYVDHSRDDSVKLLLAWRSRIQQAASNRFARVVIRVEEYPIEYDDETLSLDWVEQRFRHVMRLRQLALESARGYGSKFIFYLDGDVLITHPDTLRHLTSLNLSLLAPLLNCSSDPSFGANFWGDIDPQTGYYLRSDSYLDIVRRKRVGLFPVAVIHSAFLLSLQETSGGAEGFQFHPLPGDYPSDWAIDDLPWTHWAATKVGIQPVLDNSLHFGVYSTFEDRRLLSAVEEGSFSVLELEAGAFKHSLMEFHYHRAGQTAWLPTESLSPTTNHKRKLGFDRIFVINLSRRPDRLERMRYALTLLELDWQHFEAVDGRQLNSTWLHQNGIKSLSGYADPYHGRGLTMGEVGCFLSHHAVWQTLVDDPSINRVLVLEDDVRFGANFVERLVTTMKEADRLQPDWELMYLGRKIMHSDEEQPVPKSQFLTYPAYTYWTVGYAITKQGARKLVNQKPLNRMIAVDEYLPVMFDRHPNQKWKSAFEPRDLVAISAAPLLLEPNYYIGMEHYVSDTEGSAVLGASAVNDGGGECSNKLECADQSPADSRYSKTQN